MVKCPWCGKLAMSRARKAVLGPGRVVPCESCGRKVTTHWMAVLAAVPAFLGGYVMTQSASIPLGIAAVVSGVAAMAMLHAFVVPLVRSDA